MLITRRSLLLGAAGATLTGCSGGASLVKATDPVVATVDAKRRIAGRATASFDLVARTGTIDLAGRSAATWMYGDGPADGVVRRVQAGAVVRATLRNQLPADTSIHWHGIALRNDMDGVPGMTQRPIAPQATFTYEFTAPDPGTYFFHPHVGLQLDRGLYAPLVVEDPNEASAPDVDVVIVLDDWLDGVEGNDPDRQLASLKSAMAAYKTPTSGGMAGMGGMGGSSTMGGMAMAGSSDALGGDAGDVRYPMFLLNGRPPADRQTIESPPRGRVRLRFINAGGDTAFRVALGGHRLRITHADGWPIVPSEVDAVLLGMGERVDAEVEVTSGAWPLVALAEGKGGRACAVLRTSDAAASAPPPIDARPTELDGDLFDVEASKPADRSRLGTRGIDRVHNVTLGQGDGYSWLINGRRHDEGSVLGVDQGQRIALRFENRTSMWHPMHLHGHTFALGADGIRKDTLAVLPGKTQQVVFDADNPGAWMIHCHNAYHLEAGMATTLGYRR